MIRQIRRLTRPLPAAGPGALTLAVYAEAHDDRFAPRVAAEQGFEGVACVDDAARAAGLYCAIWRRHRFPWAREAAEGLLRFVGYMQEDDGRFVNFILDWDGRKNRTGPSSTPGGWAWQARAMHALALGVATLGAPEYARRFQLGLSWLERPTLYLDVRAVCILAALEHWTATAAEPLAARALAWAEEVAAARIGDVLPDAPDQPIVHLWGHLQEAALARVGQTFQRTDLVHVARASAEALLIPAVARAFEAPTTLPFEVSSAVAGLRAVADATGETRYAEQAELARAWFLGRNAADRPIYDRARGLVHDGIDAGQVNANSGAESNVEGALALFERLPWEEYGVSSGVASAWPGRFEGSEGANRFA